MKRTFATVACMLCSALALMACRGDKSTSQGEADSATPTASATAPIEQPVVVGDEVVVESGKASFWQGTVTKIEGDTITYEYGTNKSTSNAPRDKVHRVDATGRTPPVQGLFVVCRTGPKSWNGCLIKQVDGASFMVEDRWGRAQTLTAADVIVPEVTTQRDIQEALATQAKNRSFFEAAKAAGGPKRPDGWQPRPGDQVVALFAGSSWYGGKITKVTPSKVRVAWDDKTAPSDRAPTEVAPKPSTPHEVKEGEYVIGRPRTGSRWDYYKVVKVEATEVELIDKEDNTRRLKKSDILPLVSATP